MENTNDKSFVSHNSDKPFIRTMEDDLKKIKNSPVRNDGAASVFSYSRPKSAPRKEANRPAPILDPEPVSAPILNSASESAVPKNLPVDRSFVDEEEPKIEVKAEVPKPFKAVKDGISSKAPEGNRNLDRPSLFANSLTNEKTNEKKFSPFRQEKFVPTSAPAPVVTPAPVFKPITPASTSAFSRKMPGREKLFDETENLSPEARLARQSSLDLGDIEIGSKEILTPPPIRTSSSVIPGRSDKFAKSFNSIPSASSSSENRKKTIEEVLEEDKSNSFLGKFIKILFLFLIIGGIVVGVYYLYVVKKPAANPVSTSTPVPVQSFVSGITEVTIEADLNTDLKNEIKLYFSNNTRPSGIYRLILKDKNNQNTLGLESFKKSLNIILPDSIANALEKDYNLLAFNYPEKNYLRLGLVLRPKNSFDIYTLARSWEPDMYGNTEAIFMGDSGMYDAKKQFGSNKRNNFDIRYLPLGFDNIGLNYAIDSEKKFLLIATSKQDIFNLIDKMIKGK